MKQVLTTLTLALALVVFQVPDAVAKKYNFEKVTGGSADKPWGEVRMTKKQDSADGTSLAGSSGGGDDDQDRTGVIRIDVDKGGANDPGINVSDKSGKKFGNKSKMKKVKNKLKKDDKCEGYDRKKCRDNKLKKAEELLRKEFKCPEDKEEGDTAPPTFPGNGGVTPNPGAQ